MSTNEIEVQVEQQAIIETQSEQQTDGLTDFLSERDNKYKKALEDKKERVAEEKKEPKKAVEKTKPTKKESEEKPKESTKKKPVVEEDDDDEDQPKESKEQAEIKKLTKMLADSTKWGHSKSTKNKAALRHAQQLLDDDSISEEHFKKLSDLLQVDEPEEEIIHANESPLAKVIRVANTRVSDLAELNEDDELFTKKLGGFDMLIRDSTEAEQEEILEQLSGLEKTPLKLAKKMYELGCQYYDEFYKDIEESGGFKKYAASKRTEIERLQKKIDKLTTKLSQYESHDKPTHRLDELNEGFGGDETPQPKDGMSQFFEARDQRRRRR